MAVKTDVLLLAESGDVTVARRTAFYTYGKFDVILPEGQEQEETDGRLTDGYIARAHDGNVGRFDFGFIRADATVNIDAGTSDLETQIDSAELRSEGDVFFEGDIGTEGFNGFVPGVDFDTGDIVSVTRWGSRLSLPVTDIEYEVSDSGGPRASRVHVSGQLIHDAASRRRSNDEIRQQIAAEKRERLRQVGAVDQKATQAKDTADTALQATSDNRTYIDQKIQEAYDSIELGRGYLESMQKHLVAGTASSSLATQFASEANKYAMRAEEILDGLDPLRDDVVDIHGDVAALGEEARQLASQAEDAVQQAINKLAEADGKLAEADQKLQEQIDILEDSQRLLARASQALAAGLAHAVQAAQSALMAADDAGKAAGSALDAAEDLADTVTARQETIDTFMATQDLVNAEQTELINQINAQQQELIRMQNEGVNTIMATSAGTSFPGVNTRASSGGYDWEFTIPDTKGALAKIEFWSGTGISKTLTDTQVSAVTSSGLVIRTYNDRFVQVTWAKPKAIQRAISELSTTAFTPSQTTWTTVSGISVTAGNRASQGYLTVRVRWNAANRGSTYGIRLLVNGAAVGQKYSSTIGPLSFFGDGTVTQTVNIPNVSVPAGKSVQVQVYSTADSSSARRVTRVELTGSWIETQ